jgi:hypothetical protein
MIIPIAASAAGALVSLAAAVRTVMRLYWKRRAERELLAVLRTLPGDEGQRIQAVRNVLRAPDAPLPPDQLAWVEEILEVAAKRLRREEQEQILEGLQQPSEQGRTNYVRKLLSDEAGVPAQ